MDNDRSVEPVETKEPGTEEWSRRYASLLRRRHLALRRESAKHYAIFCWLRAILLRHVNNTFKSMIVYVELGRIAVLKRKNIHSEVNFATTKLIMWNGTFAVRFIYHHSRMALLFRNKYISYAYTNWLVFSF